MRELNLLEGYPSTPKPRLVSNDLRTINHRLIACKRDKRFFDGDREFGYGGYNYDGRWKTIANNIITTYSLNGSEKILQINSEKGFLLKDLKDQNPNLQIYGTETSEYAIESTVDEIKKDIFNLEPIKLPFPDNYFDFVIALGVVYTLNLEGASKLINEINRITKKFSFITLASYNRDYDYFLFKDWTLLGTTILKKTEWIDVLNSLNYTGDYFFTNAATLNLKRI
jgi:SAM-dependent methyltransferase